MFDLAKAAQIVAFFALKSSRSINILKVVKLAYLADRESAKTIGQPLLHDYRVSMKHGPVNSGVLDALNGSYDRPEWTIFLEDRADHMVAVRAGIDGEDLDELSAYDISILERVWAQFGAMDQWEIRDWTYDKKNVPEWTFEETKRVTQIDPEDLLRAVGFEDPKAGALAYEQSAAYQKFFNAIIP